MHRSEIIFDVIVSTGVKYGTVTLYYWIMIIFVSLSSAVLFMSR